MIISSVHIDLNRWLNNNNIQQLRISVVVDGKEYNVKREMKSDDFITGFDYIFDIMKHVLKESIKADIE
jgi:fatty acid-binding protein DegV